MIDPTTWLGSDRAVAALLLSVDEGVAAAVLRHLSDASVDRIASAMRDLRETGVDRETILAVQDAAVRRLRSSGRGRGQPTDPSHGLLSRAFGEERGRDTERQRGDARERRPFAVFEALAAADLANLINAEHPQIAAVFIAHIHAEKAGEVLNCLDEELRADLVRRVATLDRTPPDLVQRVLAVMKKKVEDLGLATPGGEPKAWIRAAAALLNNLGRGEKDVLDRIEAVDTAIAESIRDEMFTFADLALLDRRSLRRVVAEADSRRLALALRAASPAVVRAILGNMGNAAAEVVRQQREGLGPTPLSEVLAAQAEIVRLVRALMDRGEVRAPNVAEQLV